MEDRRAGYFAANRANWNERADIHADDEAGFYAIDALLAGANLLTPIELGELGDVTGLRIAHFQCHIGTDTLSLKRLGAAEIVGLDFSSTALVHARSLAERCGLDVRFVEGSVYDAPALLGSGFDRVFTSWGTICWLDDLGAWAEAAADVLKPGGKLYFADTHPYALTLDADDAGSLYIGYPYRTAATTPHAFAADISYDGSTKKIKSNRTYEWQHPLSSILNALIAAGLRIDFVTEHDALPWQIYPFLEKGTDRLFRLPEGHLQIPLAVSIGATKS